MLLELNIDMPSGDQHYLLSEVEMFDEIESVPYDIGDGRVRSEDERVIAVQYFEAIAGQIEAAAGWLAASTGEVEMLSRMVTHELIIEAYLSRSANSWSPMNDSAWQSNPLIC